MNFKQAKFSDVNGTSLKGYLNAQYGILVTVFGEPHHTNLDGKVQVEWELEFEDGTIATIYDWKEYQPVEYVTEWHIGGHEKRAVELVTQAYQKYVDSLIQSA